MSDNRTKNASRNMVFGYLERVVSLLLPFITRTIILRLLGEMYLGIGSLFTSVLSFLSLTELGLGSAVVFAMYKPVASGDTEAIGALLNYYKRMYRAIGLTILGIGTILVPAIPYLIKGDVPAGVNVYILYYIYLINAAVSYLFAGYRQSLLTAHQRADISSKIYTIVRLLVNFGQVVVLVFTRNFYVYAFVPICGSLISNVALALLTRRIYPNIKCQGIVPLETKKAIGKKMVGLFGTKLNSVVVHSADIMVLSAFMGLSATAKYSNYYYIMNTICGFVTVFYSSMTAGIGNRLVSESLEENYKLFKNLSMLNAWLVGICSVCFLCLFEPFMTLWVGEEMLLGMGFVILMVFYFFIYEIQRTILTFKDAAGLWGQDKYRPYISMCLNLVTNLILVQFIGVYGVVVSTIISFLISVPWINHVLFKYLFKKSKFHNLLNLLKYMLVTAMAAVIAYLLCELCGDGFLGLAERLLICLIIPNVVFVGVFFKTDEFRYVVEKVRTMIKK